jgi:hypothetical protein
MEIETKLGTLGFQKLPSLDPIYFEFRDRVGFLLLVQINKKLRYQLHTINAHRCLETARAAVLGMYADRAVDLKAALRESQIDDWEVYFRPNGLYPGQDHQISFLLGDYRNLNTRRSLHNPHEITWSYRVHYAAFNRSFVINSRSVMTDEEAVCAFLYKWRQSLGTALRRGTIALTAYYTGCEELAQASKQWMNNEFSPFSITWITLDKREKVVKKAGAENFRNSIEYHKQLSK